MENTSPHRLVNIHFSDFFGVEPWVLESYGAFNISLINDLPLFVDPFLIFNSTKPKYQTLHANIIRYLRFLRAKAGRGVVDKGLLEAWYHFSEVKQNWLGYSRVGNRGTGLGAKFAGELHANLGSVFSDFGHEQITKGSHLERVCLISEGVGRDNISDFTTNLIMEYLLEYTQTFARTHIHPSMRRTVPVTKVRFNYMTETWESGQYELPCFHGDYVLLTPKDLLTKDEMWISRQGLYDDFLDVAASIPNDQLRAQISNYFYAVLPDKPGKQERQAAAASTIRQFPQLIEYYIRYKEDKGEEAVSISSEHVVETETLFIKQLDRFVQQLLDLTAFYDNRGSTYDETMARVQFLKNVIENNDGYRVFYVNGEPVKREQDLQIMFRLTWFGTPLDVNREVNNGRGPVDFKISEGSRDKLLVEFKLASNTQLKRNLENQVGIYEKANGTEQSIKVIMYFSAQEHIKVIQILDELGLGARPDIILIDARSDNKVAASKA